MAKITIFENIFGHIWFQAEIINTALAVCLRAAGQKQDLSVLASAIESLDGSLADTLKSMPKLPALMKRYAIRQPKGNLRSAEADYKTLTEAEQAVVAGVISNALGKWSLMKSKIAAPLDGQNKTWVQSFQSGQEAFERMLDLDCFLGSHDKAQAYDFLDKMVASLTGQTVGAVVIADQPVADQKVPWRPAPNPPRRISLHPSKLSLVRRATRVLSMVHELHNAGYQRIRIYLGFSPSGLHWRCHITPAMNIAPDGFSITEFDVEHGLVAQYTTGQDNGHFDWNDSAGLNARELAARFLIEFPKIAEARAGRDYLYAGWLTDVLGQAEQGGYTDVVAFYADYHIDPAHLRLWQPPPPPVRG